MASCLVSVYFCNCKYSRTSYFFNKKVACCYQAVVVAVVVHYNAESSWFVTDHSKRHTVKKLNTSHQKWSEKDRQKNRSDGCNVRWIWWFEDEWRGDTSQGNQVSTWRSERQEMDSPLSHHVGIQACQHLDFAPWDPRLTYDLQNGKIINLRGFNAISFFW